MVQFASDEKHQITLQDDDDVLKDLNDANDSSHFDEEPLDLDKEDIAFFLCTKENCFRKIMLKIIHSKPFEYLIMALIILASVQLAWENPLQDPNDPWLEYTEKFDLVGTIIFAIEAVLKILAYGLIINGPDSYLRSWFNVIDLLVVST